MKVWFSTHLRAYTQCSEADVEASSLAELMRELDRRYPGLKFRIVDEQERIREHIAVFVNKEQARELGVALAPSDHVRIMGALSGG